MPFPSTHPIHPQWEDHHQPTVLGTHRAIVHIRRPGAAGDWTPEDGPTPGGEPTVVYDGNARVTFIHRGGAGAGETGPGGQPVADLDYRLGLPVGTPVRFGDQVTVELPTLAGHRLTVRRVGFGTENAELYAYCVQED